MSEETIPQMREQIKTLEKTNKGLVKENGDLSKEVRRFGARDAFREQGLPATYGDLYATQNPEGEISAESVIEFTESFNLPAVGDSDDGDGSDSGGENAQPVGDGNEDLASLSRSGSRAGDGNPGGAETEPLTREEWLELYSTDPDAAKAAVASGRVELSKGNPYAAQTGSVRGRNPYAQRT
jgi:hypothetical protein